MKYIYIIVSFTSILFITFFIMAYYWKSKKNTVVNILKTLLLFSLFETLLLFSSCIFIPYHYSLLYLSIIYILVFIIYNNI